MLKPNSRFYLFRALGSGGGWGDLSAGTITRRCIIGLVSRRNLTSQQAAVALRPFYNVVHPDRFGREPEARTNNEKALQVFNGYLNEIFDGSISSLAHKSVQITFTIRRKDSDALDNVKINITGSDPAQIVRTALEGCNLSTDHVPIPSRTLDFYTAGLPHRSSTESDSHTTNSHGAKVPKGSSNWSPTDDLWTKLHDEDLRRRKRSTPYQPPPNNLSEWATRRRDDALGRLEVFERTRESLEDQVHEIIRKTGIKEILWSINWDLSYMRRCLTSIDDMLSQADSKLRHTITCALFGRSLILGRGSFVCCNGSLQFGADDTTGAWQKVCLEANVRRFEVQNLKLLKDRVRELFGGARMIVNPHASLLATTEQMQTIIVRISMRPQGARRRIAEMGTNAIVEVVNAYCELVILRDGRLQIPCNVDGESLEIFLQKNARDSLSTNRRMRNEEAMIFELRRTCCVELELHSLTWDSCLTNVALIDALERLSKANVSIRGALRGLAVHFSHSPDVHVQPNGKLAIPINWV